MSGISRYNGTWNQETAKHLARRTLFGTKTADVQHFLNIGLDQSVSELLTAAPTPDPPVNHYQNIFADTNVPYGSTWVNQASYPVPNPLLINLRRDSLKAWWLSLMINQNRSLTEKMTLFWHNHFAVNHIGFYGLPDGHGKFKEELSTKERFGAISISL